MDKVLSADGLSYAQSIIDFLFTQAPCAALIFTAGLLLALWQLVRSGSYHPLIIFFFLFISIPLLAKPVLLNFLGKFGDVITTGAISVIDAAMPDQAKYLTAPFGLQRSSLSIREDLDQGFSDAVLQQRLNKFLYDQYLPALGVNKNNPISYPPNTQRQWQDLQRDLKNNFTGSFLTDKLRTDISYLTQSSRDIEEALIKSTVRRGLNGTARIRSSALPWQISFWGITAFPYIYGFANLLLYAFFPLAVLVLVLSRRAAVLLHYLKTLVWIKSWALGGALSFYASLFVARLQAQASPNDPSWAWEQPYYCLAAVILLCFTPLATFLIIQKTGGHV